MEDTRDFADEKGWTLGARSRHDLHQNSWASAKHSQKTLGSFVYRAWDVGRRPDWVRVTPKSLLSSVSSSTVGSTKAPSISSPFAVIPWTGSSTPPSRAHDVMLARSLLEWHTGARNVSFAAAHCRARACACPAAAMPSLLSCSRVARPAARVDASNLGSGRGLPYARRVVARIVLTPVRS